MLVFVVTEKITGLPALITTVFKKADRFTRVNNLAAGFPRYILTQMELEGEEAEYADTCI